MASPEMILAQYAKTVASQMFASAVEMLGLPKFEMKTYTSFSFTRRASVGGKGGRGYYISLVLTATICDCDMSFRELPEYEDDAEIGTMLDCTRRKYIEMLAAHEVAHVLTVATINNMYGEEQRAAIDAYESHGKLFQQMLRLLRTNFVNNGHFDDLFIDPAKIDRDIRRKYTV